jgi:hypothetical protein
LIRTDIQISSVAAFSKGSDLWAFSILLALPLMYTEQEARLKWHQGGSRGESLAGDHQRSLPEK